MGVRGLSAFLRQYGGRAALANPVDIRLLALAAIKRSGQAHSTVCVDGNSLLYYLYENNGLNWLLGGQYAAFERKVEEFVEAFESCGIGLVFCFDGLVDSLKRATSLERRAKDAKYATSVLHSLNEHENLDGPPRLLLPLLAAEAFVGTLQRRGVEVRFSHYEADREIARYCATHPECIGAVSQDSDFLVFDMGEACYLPLDSLQIKPARPKGEGGRSWTISCQTFRIDLTARMFNFDKKWMPIFASLVGNDYTRGEAALVKLHRQMNVIASDNVAQIIRKVAKFLSRFTPEEKELDVYMYLMKYMRRDERSHLHQVLKSSVCVYNLSASTSDGCKETLGLKHESGMNEALSNEFRLGRFAPQLMSVLAYGEYWASVSVVDHALFDPGEIYRELRLGMYRALLGRQRVADSTQTGEGDEAEDESGRNAARSNGTEPEQQQHKTEKENKNKKSKGGGPTLCVSELMQSQRSYRKRSNVKLTDAGHIQLPPIVSLRLMTDDERLRLFFATMRADSLLVTDLPSGLLLPCAVLRYLLNDPGPDEKKNDERYGRAEPLLYEWELDAYLRHLVRLRRKEPNKMGSEAAWDRKMQGVDRKRFVCLANLVQAGLQHGILLHQVCGHPLGPQLPPPSLYYDGFVLLGEYVRRWDARRAERRGGGGSTPLRNKEVEEEKSEEKDEGEDSGLALAKELREGEAVEGEEEEQDGEEEQRDGGDDVAQEELEKEEEEEEEMFVKAKAAIVAGLRPNPNIIKQNERARPSIFKVEVTKQANKKRRRKNKNGEAKDQRTSAKASDEANETNEEEEGESERVAVHNSFALLGSKMK